MSSSFPQIPRVLFLNCSALEDGADVIPKRRQRSVYHSCVTSHKIEDIVSFITPTNFEEHRPYLESKFSPDFQIPEFCRNTKFISVYNLLALILSHTNSVHATNSHFFKTCFTIILYTPRPSETPASFSLFPHA